MKVKTILIILFLSISACTSKITNLNVTRDNYDMISKDMTTGQVIAIIGDPDSKSETDNQSIGKMEMWHYQLGLKAINVTFIDGKVYDKTWIEL